MPNSDEQTKTDYSGFIIAVLLLPVFLLLRHLGRIDLALPACIYLGMVFVAIRIRWDLRGYIWFWCIIALVLLVQMLIVVFVPFPHITITRITILPIGLADFLLILGVVHVAEKIFGVSTQHED